MPASISITNITDNMVLGQDFTVYGDFAASYGPKTSGDTTTYALVRSPEADSARAVISVRCHLKSATGGLIHTEIGFVDASNTRWQANFTGQPPGTNLKLIPELAVDTSSLTGAAIVGLEIKGPIGIIIVPPPPPPPPLPPPPNPGPLRETLPRKTLKPHGEITIPGTVHSQLPFGDRDRWRRGLSDFDERLGSQQRNPHLEDEGD